MNASTGDPLVKVTILRRGQIAMLCPACGRTLTDVAGSRDVRSGDRVICANCFVYLVVADDIQTLRILTNKEWADLPLDVKVQLTERRTMVQGVRGAQP